MMETATRTKAAGLLNEVLLQHNAISINAAIILKWLDQHGLTVTEVPPSAAQAIARNTVKLPAAALKREDSVLELIDGPGDRHEQMDPAKVSPYKPPRDPRVQGVLKAAAAAREADKPTGKVFTDPRLEPGYGKKKK